MRLNCVHLCLLKINQLEKYSTHTQNVNFSTSFSSKVSFQKLVSLRSSKPSCECFDHRVPSFNFSPFLSNPLKMMLPTALHEAVLNPGRSMSNFCVRKSNFSKMTKRFRRILFCILYEPLKEDKSDNLVCCSTNHFHLSLSR